MAVKRETSGGASTTIKFYHFSDLRVFPSSKRGLGLSLDRCARHAGIVWKVDSGEDAHRTGHSASPTPNNYRCVSSCISAGGSQSLPILTFLDSSVLIAAHRGQSPDRDSALKMMNDSSRRLYSKSIPLPGEVPKAVHSKRTAEIVFDRIYFDNASLWVNDMEAMVQIAQDESARRRRPSHCTVLRLFASRISNP
jgi:hypothetical protein